MRDALITMRRRAFVRAEKDVIEQHCSGAAAEVLRAHLRQRRDADGTGRTQQQRHRYMRPSADCSPQCANRQSQRGNAQLGRQQYRPP